MLKGSIGFGLVFIPVSLHIAVRSHDISFNQLDRETKTRVKYKKTCLACDGRELESKDIVRGYQYQKDRYVIIEDEEIEAIKTKRDRAINIERFVEARLIDPIYFDKSYYLKPEGADKAYALLTAALEAEGKAGIARTAAWGARQTLAVVRVVDGVLMLTTMHFADEIRESPVGDLPKADNKELELARQIIGSMSGEPELEQFADEYRERLMSAIENKIVGDDVVVTTEKTEHTPTVLGLMEALKASLAETGIGAGS
ncbi:MAG: Ku protein [Firmicutes bacterium]|nr:Ku protein [Bacillota bacterium]